MTTPVTPTLTETLRANICIVTFTKKNGDERVMRCTLQESMLLLMKGLSPILTEQAEIRDPANIPVVDLDKNEWRSIPVARVKNIEIVSAT